MTNHEKSIKGTSTASDWGMTRSLTGKSLLKHELVSEKEWKGGREGLRLDVKAQEADGEGDRALPRAEPAKEVALRKENFLISTRC